MHNITIIQLIFLCIAGFFAAFVDSIAGGGGLISLPALLLTGIPPHFALGTNKFASTTASFTSSLRFAKSGKVNFKLLRYLIPFTLVGAAFGVTTVLKIDAKYLQFMVLILILFVGIYSFFSKNSGAVNKFKRITLLSILLGIILAFSLGFYDGFFGPGTGSFLIFGFISIYGFDFVNSAGNARILNFVSNITALAIFSIHGQIDLYLGIPVALFMIIGANMGTKMALKNGIKLIKPIFIVMSLAVAVKLLLQII